MFRDLKVGEVEARIQSVKEGKGAILILYKDSRTDMNMLDETVGPMNWQKSYNDDASICTVSIWLEERKCWISKSDAGEGESAKARASDSFKRACFNFGIGRELYTSPFIWINGNYTKFDKFTVVHMKVENKAITELQIVNDKTGELVYEYGTKTKREHRKEPQISAPTPEKKPFNKNAAVVEIMKLIAEDMDKLKKQLEFHKLKDLSEGSEIQLKTIYKFLRGGFNK